MSITRRDFLNGVALTIGSALTPLHQLKAQNIFLSQSSYYPPTLTGMRGSHPGSFETAHKLGREGKKFDTDSLSISEKYDYVIVGAGLSGLAAAFSIREKKPKATILMNEIDTRYFLFSTKLEAQTVPSHISCVQLN